MSILLFAESANNKLKRNAAEIASYGAALAGELSKDCVAVSFNADNAQELGQFGISKVFNVTNVPQQFDAHVYASVLTHYINSLGATHIIVGSSADAKFLAPLVAANTNAAYVPNVVALPHEQQPLTVRRTAFTNKAFANTTLRSRFCALTKTSSSCALTALVKVRAATATKTLFRMNPVISFSLTEL